MNETLNTIATRYSCRSFTSEPLTDDQVKAIAQAAIQSPSGMNAQPWRVIVVQDKQLIQDMEAQGIAHLKGLEDQSSYQRILSRGGKLFYNTSCMIHVPIDSASAYAPIDCGIVSQNITLAAASLGLSSVICGLAGLVFTPEKGAEFKERLGYPEGFQFGIAVLLGNAAVTGHPHAPDQSKISYIHAASK